mmetsp:Transcript_1049/g.3006  ORF Transcript_1049/g.3006 Transcript_1049/m.3006 type:complete len:215 (-) Transcript_1049:154-798(-)
MVSALRRNLLMRRSEQESEECGRKLRYARKLRWAMVRKFSEGSYWEKRCRTGALLSPLKLRLCHWNLGPIGYPCSRGCSKHGFFTNHAATSGFFRSFIGPSQASTSDCHRRGYPWHGAHLPSFVPDARIIGAVSASPMRRAMSYLPARTWVSTKTRQGPWFGRRRLQRAAMRSGMSERRERLARFCSVKRSSAWLWSMSMEGSGRSDFLHSGDS